MNIGAIITIILVVAWVIRGVAAVSGNNKEGSEDQARQREAIERWQREQARRRREAGEPVGGQVEVYDESQVRAIAGQSDRQGQVRDLSEMTMAQRIDLARQRAREEARLGRGEVDPAQAQRQARQRAEQEARRGEQQAEQRRQAARKQAERQRAQQERQRRAAERQRAQQEQARAERAARQKSRGQRRANRPKRTGQASTTQPPGLSEIQAREAKLRAQSQQRVYQGQGHSDLASPSERAKKARRSSASIGVLDMAALRKAIVIKEVLDKPIALRNPQDDLLS